MLSLEPLLSELTIKTKKIGRQRFDLHYVDPELGDLGWAQRPFVAEIERQYNQNKPVRVIVLKARQLGISTATEATLFYWMFLHPGANGLVIAHDVPTSQELFEMTKLYWETWPFRSAFSLKYQTKQNLHWKETASRLRIATAKNVQSGRGATLHAVHASECAFYDDPATLFTGLNQTVPNYHGTIIVLESTANGVGNWFHEQWELAVSGESDYVALFFPWYKHPEYQIVGTNLNIKSELDPDERALLKLGASFANIAWRRWAILNKCNGDLERFLQEYPSTPEEAFITSGQPMFPHGRLRDTFVEERGFTGMLVDQPNGNVEWVHDPAGNLTIYKKPRRNDYRQDRYFVSGDPSESVAGDPSCIQVLNRGTFEQVAVWHGRTDPITFAHEMMRVGKFYNNATLCPEAEGGGQATVGVLLERGYPSVWRDRRPDRDPSKIMNVYGWSTNFQRKSWCIGTLKKLIADRSLLIHDRKTYNQLRDYVVRPNGEWGNANPNIYDDSVMALAIGLTASIADGPFIEDRTPGVVVDLFNQDMIEEDVDVEVFRGPTGSQLIRPVRSQGAYE